METDFAALRRYLEDAWLQARGDDTTSWKVREMLDVLIEGVLLAEHSRPTPEADVLVFPKRCVHPGNATAVLRRCAREPADMPFRRSPEAIARTA